MNKSDKTPGLHSPFTKLIQETRGVCATASELKGNIAYILFRHTTKVQWNFKNQDFYICTRTYKYKARFKKIVKKSNQPNTHALDNVKDRNEVLKTQ